MLEEPEVSTIIDSVHKKSPKACHDFCEETEGCAAWSWNKTGVDKNCYAQHSCPRRVPASNMVSGMKVSFKGMWYYMPSPGHNFKNSTGPDESHLFDWFKIAVDRTGEMMFEDSDGDHGNLTRLGGLSWNEELEAKLEGVNPQRQAGTLRMRLVDGKLHLKGWLENEGECAEFIAEKKGLNFEIYDRVSIKQDHWILSDDSQNPGLMLRKGDSGTVYDPYHPHESLVIFDHDQGKTVWINDTDLAKSAILKEINEDEVRIVLGSLSDVLIRAIQDPITLGIFRDPVMASDGFTYERKAIEELIQRSEEMNAVARSPMTSEPLSSVNLFSNYAIRSLVSSVIEKVDAALGAAGKVQRRFRGYRVRKDISGHGTAGSGAIP